jgi:hypothetical protein
MPTLSNASPENNDQNIFVIKQLIDNISFDAENNQLLVEFDVKPQFIDIQQNREKVLAEQKKVTYK